MSRLEANGEPSMEEILASIRKIIAEEPPGSRASAPSPRPAPTPAAPPQRGFMSREAFMRSTHQPEPEAVEPHFSSPSVETSFATRSQPDAGHDNDRSSSEALASLSEGLNALAAGDAASSSSDDHSTEPDSKLERAADAGGSGEHSATSIDDQLAGLLADDIEPVTAESRDLGADLASPSVTPAEEAQHEVPRDAIDGQPDSEPGRSFAAPRSGGGDRPAETARDADPFAFTLEPSPFRARTTARDVPDTRTSASEQFAFGKGEPRATDFGAHRSTLNGSSSVSSIIRPATTPTPPAADATPVSAARQRDTFAVPSVAATLGPYRNLEPLSSSFQPAPAGPAPAAPLAAAEPTPSRTEISRVSRDVSETMLQPAAPNGSAMDRALEDTVADLLRPMLKTWLAENMPKIVERALRREINERMLPGQKNRLE